MLCFFLPIFFSEKKKPQIQYQFLNTAGFQPTIFPKFFFLQKKNMVKINVKFANTFFFKNMDFCLKAFSKQIFLMTNKNVAKKKQKILNQK